MNETQETAISQDTPEIENTGDSWDNITLDDINSETADTGEDKLDEAGTDAETAGADQQNDVNAEADNGDTQQDAEEQTDQFVLKHLGEEKTVSRDEVVVLAQKGMDYDRIKQQLTEEREKAEKNSEIVRSLSELAKESGFAAPEDMLDDVKATLLSEKEGIDRGIALERLKLERREAEIAKREAKLSAESKSKESEAEKAAEAERRQQADIQNFLKAYPEVKPNSIPKEVWRDVGKGETLLNAYMKYENAQLKARLAAKEKAEENRARSTGSRQSVGSASVVDEFTAAWNEA